MPSNVPEKAPRIAQEPRTDQTGISERIAYFASKWDVSAEVMETVVECESNYNPRAVGDQGHSRGLVQIHSKYHPTVTDEMAFDVDYALEFLAERLARGEGRLWTCYRTNFL